MSGQTSSRTPSRSHSKARSTPSSAKVMPGIQKKKPAGPIFHPKEPSDYDPFDKGVNQGGSRRRRSKSQKRNRKQRRSTRRH